MAAPRSPRGRRLVAYGLCALVAVGWFAWLRPTTLGGPASYVVVKGSSMEPTYDDGDLVIVRKESSYEDGDVIAFRAGGRFEDPTRVIHRIVGSTDAGFVTRGDNRDRPDPWRPGPDDVIGRAAFHVPALGDLATAAGRPAVLGALGAAAVMLGGRRRKRRRMSAVPGDGPASAGAPAPRPPRSVGTPPRWLRHTQPRWAFVALIVSTALLLPVMAVAWSAVNAPDTAIRQHAAGRVDLGIDVDYRFLGAPSPVYPSGVVATARDATGALVPAEPLYSRLLQRAEVDLAFQTAGDGVELLGTYRVDVAVGMPEGWSTTLTAVGPTDLEEAANEVVAIDLVDATARVAEVAALTGVGGDEFTIRVTPRLEVVGSADGDPVRETVAPELVFAVEGGVITAQPVEAVSASRAVVREVREGVDYRLGPLSLGTQAARGLLGGLTLVLLAAAAVSASVLFGGVGLRESERIAARYRSQIVDVAVATGPPGPVVMVSAIDELARIAKVEQSVILHEDLGDGCHRYRVFLGAVTYEYESAPEHGGLAADGAPGSSERAGP